MIKVIVGSERGTKPRKFRTWLQGQYKSTGRYYAEMNKMWRTLILGQFDQLLLLMATTCAFLLLHATKAAYVLVWCKKADGLYLVHTKMYVQRKTAR